MRRDSTTAHAVEATGLVKRFGKTTGLDFVVFAPLAVRAYRRRT
jgi:hypothetical protein